MVVMGEKQKKAFRRVCDLLEEKREIIDTLMDADERERLLEERDVLIKNIRRIFVTSVTNITSGCMKVSAMS